jgi:hypothetical protein
VIRSTLIVLAVVASVAACGSSGSGSNPTSTTAASPFPTVPTDTPAVASARLQAAKCLRAQGLDIPDFTPGNGRIRAVLRIIAGYSIVKVQAAEKACYSTLRQAFPNAFGTNLTPEQISERKHDALVFADCMRARGIDFPDPTAAAADPAAALNAINSLDTSSPALKEAAKACQAVALKSG